MLYLGAIEEGVESLRTATQLGPHSADSLFHYGDGLVHLGEMQEARRVMDSALSLNPLAPDVYHWVSATADYFLGDYRSASEGLRRMENRESAARVVAAVEAMNGNLEEAARFRDIFLAGHPGFRLEDYMFPQRRPEDREHILEGLRRAGFT
jgi:tetratricopeptide (TPR) repeat protein